MKKIIIISEFFAPQNEVAAIRMSKIVKYINKHDEYKILVVSNESGNKFDDEILKRDVEGKATVVRIKRSKTLVGIYSRLQKRRNEKTFNSISNIQQNSKINENIFSRRFKQSVFFLLELLNTMVFKHRATNYLRKIDLNEYTNIISTFGPLSCHLVASKVKKQYPNINWIADFRDPVLNIFTPFIFKYYAKNYPKHVTRNADKVVAVSSGYMEALLISEDKERFIITNGYDKEDLYNINITEKKMDKLIFAYTGGLYSGERDLSILFKVISELVKEKKIEKNKIQVKYAGTSEMDLIRQAQDFGMESIVLNHGYLSRKQSINLQLSSDVLLLATWNKSNGLGNIPGKFLEYMMMDKPIICVTKGDISESEVKKIIKSGDLGFCYEEANGVEDYEELKKFINYLYTCKVQSKKNIPYRPVKEIIESYSYEHKAKEFEKLLKK